MSLKSKKSMLFNALAFLVVTTAPPARVFCMENPAEVDEVAVSSVTEFEVAVKSLRSGQILLIDAAEVALNAPLAVTASNVAIRGRTKMTRVLCPRDGEAFVVTGTNVSLSQLEFSGCDGASALRIGTGDDQSSFQLVPSKKAMHEKKRNNEFKCKVYVSACLFVHNNSPLGGAIALINARLSIIDTTFRSNVASFAGGAIFTTSSKLEVEQTIFLNNSAPKGYGGAVCMDYGDLAVTETEFGENRAGQYGGAMYVTDADLRIKDSNFDNNQAADIGGAIFLRSSEIRLETTLLVNNFARRHGGALYAKDTNLAIMQTRFGDNVAATRGGAVYLLRGNLTVGETTFDENQASKYGGAVFVWNGSMTAQVTKFHSNQAYYGGAIYSADSTLTIESSAFDDNKAAENFQPAGGAILATGETSDHVTQVKDTNFTRNSAEVGGAILVRWISLKIAGSRFVENTAVLACGAVCSLARGSDLSVSFCYFERNAVRIETRERASAMLRSRDPFDLWHDEQEKHIFMTVGGGAIGAQEAASFDVWECIFRKNYAFQGGAIVATGTAIPSKLDITSCLFEANEGDVSGGALFADIGCEMNLRDIQFRDNSAQNGGAIHLGGGARMSNSYNVDYHLYFENNTAVIGGAIYCSTCVLHLNGNATFDQNVALESGGAAYIAEAGQGSNIDRAIFDQNVAAFGGALFLKDCLLFRLSSESALLSYDALSCSSQSTLRFTKNIALEGGALYLESQNSGLEAYKIQRSCFEENRAVDLEVMTSEINSTQWLRCTSCVYGRGGAIFIALHNKRVAAIVNLMLLQLEIIRNDACVGGGIYIDNEPGNWNREIDMWCQTFRGLREPPCQFLAFESVNVINNTASITGGGLFYAAPKDLSSVCIVGEQNSSRSCRTGNANVVRLENNQISKDGGGYGPDLATGARSLNLLNVDGRLERLKSGEKLLVWSQETESNASTGSEIRLVLKDMLSEIVSGGTKDAELEVELVSKWVSGVRAYNATDGFITINDTLVTGVSVTDKLVIQAQDERNMFVTLEFSTLPCSDGELRSEGKGSCFRCRKNFYTFNASQDGCQLCEDNAICDGTTALVPTESYWHANPFSPVMRRCLVKKACMYKGREDALMKYYDVYEQVKAELAKFGEQNAVESLDFFETYPQCASGYKGTLCGTCAGNYGHTSGGACKECDQNLGLTRFLTVLIIALFGVITFKVVLEIRGVVEDVSFELAQQRTAIESFIGQASNQALVGHRSVRSEQNVDSATSSQRQTERAERTELTEASSAGAGLSAGSSVKRPLLQRLDKIEDPTAETEKDADTPSPELMDASASLSDTYNILYNYMQLNSVALSLDVDWTKTLRYFFSVEASLARLMDIQFLPFDCSFGDREDDSGFPNSLASLWYRVCFPLATIAVYLLAMKIYVWIRGERRRSKYQVGLPTMRLIFLVVYLSCCIDIFADLLRVMKCVDLTPDIPENHPYAKYEVMERKSVWMGDTAVICWEGAHLASAIVAGIGLCVCVGIIVFTVIILFVGKRGRRLRNPQFLLSYGFLYLSYRTDGVALYWESVITLRRMLMAAVGVYAEHGETSNVQIGFLAFIIFIFIAVHEVVGPFDQEDSKDVIPSYAGRSLRILGANDVADQWLAFNQYVTLNGMEGASLFMSLSLFLVATSINDEKDNRNEIDCLLIVCFAVNAVFVLFMLLRLWYGVHHYLDVIAKERNITFRAGAVPGQDSVSSFPKKLWIILKSSRKDPIVEERDEGEP